MTRLVPLSSLDVAVDDPALRGGVITIGNFDGVHRGHASLLGQTCRLAETIGGPSIACLFDPHPIAVLRPELAPQRLTSVDERALRMSAIGVDYLVVCRTTPALLNLSARDFFESLVRDNLGCKGVVEGQNFCFGKDRQGDVDLLERLCAENDIEFQVAEMESTGGEMISSTRIRDALLAGDVTAASQMMGTPHKVVGRVVPGDARGRAIGFPTANLAQIQVVIPAPGVYAAIGRIGTQTFPAAVHIGESPTFGSGDENKVEVHLIGFDGDLYGQQLAVEFVQRIRGIVRFDSLDELTSQLRNDIRSCTELLREFTSEPK